LAALAYTAGGCSPAAQCVPHRPPRPGCLVCWGGRYEAQQQRPPAPLCHRSQWDGVPRCCRAAGTLGAGQGGRGVWWSSRRGRQWRPATLSTPYLLVGVFDLNTACIGGSTGLLSSVTGTLSAQTAACVVSCGSFSMHALVACIQGLQARYRHCTKSHVKTFVCHGNPYAAVR
jgi:hypothetical protein